MTSGDPQGLRDIAERLASKVTPVREARQVRLFVAHLGLWTTAKNAFIVGVIGGIGTIVAAFTAWTLFANAGGLQSVAALFSTGSSASVSKSVSAVVNERSVVSIATALALVQVLATVVISVVVALAYNAAVRMTGGILLGFEARDRRA